jgi:hypothetical protein
MRILPALHACQLNILGQVEALEDVPCGEHGDVTALLAGVVTR